MVAPVEKNLKHKTDVVSWGDVRWQSCDLNFRTPSSARLWLSPAQTFSGLTVASGSGTAGILLLGYFVMPFLAERSLVEAMVVACLVALLVATGFYRLMPRVGRPQASFDFAVFGGASVLSFYLVLRYGYHANLFTAGVFLLWCLALPACLYVCDQMTGLMVHWIAADPRADRNTMVALRNAWCGRFVTEHLQELRKRGVSSRTIRALGNYAWGLISVGIACAVGCTLGLLIAKRLELSRVGMVMVGGTTASLVLLTLWSHFRYSSSGHSFSQTLGHWFEFQRDTISPPWTMQSPAGSQLRRAFSTYAAVFLLSGSFLALGLCDSGWIGRTIGDAQQASIVETVTVGLGSALLTPLWMLLAGYVVTAPVAGACLTAVEEVSNG